ncbi:DNA-binding LacI/PurR family transcriptional regulator [Bacillus mesophilus]|nr:DNA-binding LacI/PurR family transcriptional regulator [Bacillus mesophilus]
MLLSITIKDVAKLANVAPSTVSRVIADHPNISGETKERVREAMKELGYHPNFIARSLASNSTQSIGLVMPSSADKALQNPFFPEVIRGISKGAHEKKYSLHISTGESLEEIFDGVVQMVQGRRVDGIILLYSRFNDKIIDYLLDQSFPFVVIGKPYKYKKEITYVDNDNVQASIDVTEYLIKLGHKRVAFVGGSLNLVVTIDRLQGFKHAILSNNLPYRDEYVKHVEFLKEGGREAITELLSLEKPPTALVVMDDLMALGVLNKLDEMGKAVPDDISVVGFNNVLLTEISRPPLTSVDINIFQLGYQAAKSLIDQTENQNQPVKRIMIPHNLVIRESCYENKQNL